MPSRAPVRCMTRVFGNGGRQFIGEVGRTDPGRLKAIDRGRGSFCFFFFWGGYPRRNGGSGKLCARSRAGSIENTATLTDAEFRDIRRIKNCRSERIFHGTRSVTPPPQR